MKIIKKIREYFRTIWKIAGRTGSTGFDRVRVALDIICCRIGWGCSVKDYERYQFYKYKNLYRKNFIGDHHKKQIAKWCKPTGADHNKWNDYQILKDLMSRGILLLPKCGQDAFVSFLKKHRKIVIKPCNSRAGAGLRIVEYTTDADAVELFSKIESDMLCEEYVYQHSAIAALNPSSLNTIRIVTIYDGHRFQILSAALKMGGSADSIADNLHRNGLAAGIHLESGIIHTFGRDYANHIFTHHPVTGTQIIGIQIPHWEVVKETVKRAHLKMPAKPYIGWDVAITQTGVEIIEANIMPGHVTMQYFDQIPKGKPVLEQARQCKSIH